MITRVSLVLVGSGNWRSERLITLRHDAEPGSRLRFVSSMVMAACATRMTIGTDSRRKRMNGAAWLWPAAPCLLPGVSCR